MLATSMKDPLRRERRALKVARENHTCRMNDDTCVEGRGVHIKKRFFNYDTDEAYEPANEQMSNVPLKLPNTAAIVHMHTRTTN